MSTPISPLRPKRTRRRRLRNGVIIGTAVAAVIAVSGPTAVSASQQLHTSYTESRPAFKAELGHWDMLSVPEKFRLNSVHAALLPTGKVLLIAGSGNNADNFKAKSFDTLLWDPKTNNFKKIATPEDLFCGGHAFLPNGNLLVAGGTRKYEVLAGTVTRAAGVAQIKNEDPNDVAFTIPKGTEVRGANGKSYRTTEPATVQPAVQHVMDGRQMTMPSQTQVWVEALDEGKASVVTAGAQYQIQGLTGTRTRNVYLVADKLTLDKQEYRGLDSSYEFNPFTETYVATGKLAFSRWYPTLVGTQGGNVLAVSGLDQYGNILPGNNELYERSLHRWFDQPGLFRYFPTYPSLFRIQGGSGNQLFYSGMNAGYGSATEARTPGIWDLNNNTFRSVPGLRDPGMNETGASLLLPPAQKQKVMVLGGGGVGDTADGTARSDIVDLTEPAPRFTPGPDLKVKTRYLNTTILPDDTVFATGGSSDYRGRGGSDLLTSYLYDPAANQLHQAAPPHVGRDYHAESILLPDGRVMVLGSDPLYADHDNKTPGTFEQRIEIYSPPYLFHGPRPTVTAPQQIARGTTFGVTVTDPAQIASARLVRPGASTHVTDVEQRSVALDITPCSDDATKTTTQNEHSAKPGEAGRSCCCDQNLQLSLDRDEALTPSGFYMLFVTDKKGVPSQARWVQVQ